MKDEEGAARTNYVLVLSTGTGESSAPSEPICSLLIMCQTFHPAQRQFWEGEVFKTSKRISSAGFPVTDRLLPA